MGFLKERSCLSRRMESKGAIEVGAELLLAVDTQ